MEVRCLVSSVITGLLLLLSVQVQHSCCHKADASFPRLVPSRLQFFEYESVSINCEELFNELAEWRVMRKFNNIKTTCNVKWEKTGSCNIPAAYPADSGEYWCQAGGKTSSTVNIVVTAGPVILESPVLPVMEGDDVVLRCINKTASNPEADFYKDGILIGSSSTGNMIIRSVSRSDEGLYRCAMSGAESAESRLALRAGPVILESPAGPVMEGSNITLHCRSEHTVNVPVHFYKDGILIMNSSTGNMTIHSISKSDEGLYRCHISGAGSAESRLAVTAPPTNHEERLFPDSLFTYVCTLISTVSAVLLLLSVVGLCCWYKGASPSVSYVPTSSSLQTVSPETGANDITYAAVTISRKNDTSLAEQQPTTKVDVSAQEPKNETDTSEAQKQQATNVDVSAQEPQNETDTSEAQKQQATNADVSTQEPTNRRDEDESAASCLYQTLSFVSSESANPP